MADDGWTDTIGSEFGEVDNPDYSGNSKASWDTTQWNVGAGGANLAGWATQGVALPDVPLGTLVKVRNPDTGAETTATVVDSGPGKSTGAGIDLLAGTRSALGYPVNYKGPVQYQVVSGDGGSGSSNQTGSTLSSQTPSLASNTASLASAPQFPSASTAQQKPQQQTQQKPQQQQQKPGEEYKAPPLPALKGMQTAQLDPALQQNAQNFSQMRASEQQNVQKQKVDYTKSYDVLAKYFGEDDAGSGQQQSDSSSTTS